MKHRGLRSHTIRGFRRLAALWSAQGELERIVATHFGPRINKFSNFFEAYERHFARFRGRPVTICEIGVDEGGSLELWRRFFGEKARLVGIDTNPACRARETPGTRIFIGDQGNPEFLEQVAAETGPFDIVIDDGSHAYEHQLTTFRTLFPHIRADGLYTCEDLCTSYWKETFGGGVREPGTYIEFLKSLIDELNAWFWRDHVENEPDAFARATHGIHFYPALVIIEKRPMQAPALTPVGSFKKGRDETSASSATPPSPP